jgi:3-oxoacyl-[acyl-carrier-protein] synthase III
MIGDRRLGLMRMSAVDHFVMQNNISMGTFRFYEDALDVGLAKVSRANLAAYGHLGPVDVMTNISIAA